MKRRVVATAAAAVLAIGAWVCLHGAESSRAATRGTDDPGSATGVSAPDRQEAAETIPPAVAPAEPAAAPRKSSAARDALERSAPPVVAALSIDLLGSPRERLLAMRGAPAPARADQLDTLSDRTRAHIKALEQALATASGPERARIEQDLATFQKNDRYRSRLISPTVRSSTRPGAARTATP